MSAHELPPEAEPLGDEWHLLYIALNIAEIHRETIVTHPWLYEDDGYVPPLFRGGAR